jgi:hypothetical protein
LLDLWVTFIKQYRYSLFSRSSIPMIALKSGGIRVCNSVWSAWWQ